MKNFLFPFFLLIPLLYAKEPTIMLLDHIYYNDLYMFHKAKERYLCQPYGVLSLDILIRQQEKLTTTCKTALQKLLQSQPMLLYFAKKKLLTEQSYRVELLQKGCVIFSKGGKTFSEELLENGIAIIDPTLKDEEYFWYFTNALNNAKNRKKGIWQNTQVKTCILEVTSKKE
jgi:hypothetical protein